MNNQYDSLYDSDTNDYLSSRDLGITDEQYELAVQESESCDQAEGHIRVNGRKVYAA